MNDPYLGHLVTGPVIEIYRSWLRGGLYNWRLRGGNNEKVCYSNQGFRDRTDARRAAERAKALMRTASIEDDGTVYPRGGSLHG